MSETAVAPRWGRIESAQSRSGLRRGKLYQIAKNHPGLVKKAGSASLWDLNRLEQIVGELPDADIGANEDAA
jgi:hypothetical protein